MTPEPALTPATSGNDNEHALIALCNQMRRVQPPGREGGTQTFACFFIMLTRGSDPKRHIESTLTSALQAPSIRREANNPCLAPVRSKNARGRECDDESSPPSDSEARSMTSLVTLLNNPAALSRPARWVRLRGRKNASPRLAWTGSLPPSWPAGAAGAAGAAGLFTTRHLSVVTIAHAPVGQQSHGRSYRLPV